MEQSKILTIAIPTYNMEQYLCRCLDSLIIDEKLMHELEVLIINDGSTDKSLEIGLKYQEKYPQTFQVINKKNGNYGSCINKALNKAKGLFFKILDADDWFDNINFQSYIRELPKIKTDIILTNFCHNYSTGEKTIRKTKIANNTSFNLNKNDLKINDIKQIIAMHGLTVRTDILKENNYIQQEGICYTDVEFCFYSILYAETVTFLNINLYQYFLGREGQSVSINTSIKRYNDFFLVTYRLITDFIKQESNLSEEKNNILACIITYTGWKIFAYPLIFLRTPTSKMQQSMKEINFLIKNNKTLHMVFNKMTYYKIPFYKIWNKTSFRLASIIGK